MNAQRATPMVPIHCRIRAEQAERLLRLVALTGADRCDFLRRVIDTGLSALERELGNSASEGQS